MGKVMALCTSEKRGTLKTAQDSARFLTEWGIEGDAHAGNWHRQVSLLGLGEIEAFRARGAQVAFGAFGENVVAEGFTFKELPVGTRLACGEVVFEITQIGKKCHAHCEIYKQVGDCIMPREGVFARVLHGGEIHVGDDLHLLEGTMERDAAVLTLSDKGAAGERKDTSGPAVAAMLTEAGYTVRAQDILADDQKAIEAQLTRYAERGIGLVCTTGGTGFAMRDVTPEATIAVCDRMAPGIAEAMRMKSLAITDRAMLSRATAGIARHTLIVNLPGSERGAKECLGFVLPTLVHGVSLLRGETGECGKDHRHGLNA